MALNAHSISFVAIRKRDFMVFKKTRNEELGRMNLEEFRLSDKLPVTVVLDNVRSMNNVGSAFRTSDAFPVEKIYLTGITAQPPHREINKTALGATESVAWKYFENVSDAINQLKQEGCHIIMVEQADPNSSLVSYQPDLGEKYALIFGNEVSGVSPEVLNLADECIEIPQLGTKHSLNISVSIGIVLWVFYRAFKL